MVTIVCSTTYLTPSHAWPRDEAALSNSTNQGVFFACTIHRTLSSRSAFSMWKATGHVAISGPLDVSAATHSSGSDPKKSSANEPRKYRLAISTRLRIRMWWPRCVS